MSGRPQPDWGDAHRPNFVEKRAKELAEVLSHLEQRLLGRLGRLQQWERRLTATQYRKGLERGRRAIQVIEWERQRLGRELHTDVGQMLAAIRIQVEAVDEFLPGAAPQLRDAVQRISKLADDALHQVRCISHRIHPPEWQRLSLEEALRQLWALSDVDRHFQSSVTIEPLPDDLPVEVKSLFYRSAQEAIANIFRHSRAKRVDLVLDQRDNRLRLRLSDDGVGFNAATVLSGPASVSHGIGLRSIREQAFELNGKLLVTSGALGTTLEVSVPWVRGSAQ